MTLLLEMLSAAGNAPALLGENSTRLVGRFLLSQQNPDGGFKDRGGKSDLYYTTFGLAGLFALMSASDVTDYLDRKQAVEAFMCARDFLKNFGEGEDLDFVHLCSLARLRGAMRLLDFLTEWKAPVEQEELLARMEQFRAANGGYNPFSGATFGTAYGAYLALGAYQDLSAPVPEPERLRESLQALRAPGGGWINERTEAPPDAGATNATAAALGVLRQLGNGLEPYDRDWLLARVHAQGGFLATPTAPLPDLLSTAAALHSLAAFRVPLEPLRPRCLDFIDSLWSNAGGFHGHWADDFLDVEYTFYGLLALGNLQS